MARLGSAGAEIVAAEYFAVNPITLAGGAAPTRDTGTFRTGAASWKCDSGGGNSTSFIQPQFTQVSSTTYYVRGYVRFASLPGALVKVLETGQTNSFSARLTTGGKLRLYNDVAGTQIGSDSAATIATGTWYRIELSWTSAATATTYTAAELRLDGVTVASTSGLTLTTNLGTFSLGWFDAPGASLVVNVDDIALNDNSGAANNSWPGAGQVILMCPISDNARGAWTAGAGGTTNLFDAIDNKPPVGVAEASATNTSQIKNRTTTNPTSYDGNLASYTTAGIGASDTVNAIQVIDVDGEDPATGTKTGAPSMVSNPAIAEPTAINFGDDVGLQGTFLGNWKWHVTAVSQAPSVTLGTQPVIRMRCISGATGSRSASCCFLGAYVDYTPAASGTTYTKAGFGKENA